MGIKEWGQGFGQNCTSGESDSLIVGEVGTWEAKNSNLSYQNQPWEFSCFACHATDNQASLGKKISSFRQVHDSMVLHSSDRQRLFSFSFLSLVVHFHTKADQRRRMGLKFLTGANRREAKWGYSVIHQMKKQLLQKLMIGQWWNIDNGYIIHWQKLQKSKSTYETEKEDLTTDSFLLILHACQWQRV